MRKKNYKESQLYLRIILLTLINIVLVVYIIASQKVNKNQPADSATEIVSNNLEANAASTELDNFVFNIDGCLTITFKDDTLYVSTGSEGTYITDSVAAALGDLSNKVKKIVVNDGVTSVFKLEDSQNKLSNLQEVTLADTVVYFENLQNYTFEAGN